MTGSSRHPSTQQHTPFPPEGFQDVPGVDKIYYLPIRFWGYPEGVLIHRGSSERRRPVDFLIRCHLEQQLYSNILTCSLRMSPASWEQTHLPAYIHDLSLAVILLWSRDLVEVGIWLIWKLHLLASSFYHEQFTVLPSHHSLKDPKILKLSHMGNPISTSPEEAPRVAGADCYLDWFALCCKPVQAEGRWIQQNYIRCFLRQPVLTPQGII